MPRTTLNTKLKKRSDYDDIVKKIKSVEKRLPYIKNTFNCSSAVAQTLLEELGLKDYSDTPLEVAKCLIERSEVILSNKDADIRTLLSFKEKLDEESITSLRYMFRELFGRETIFYKEAVLKAIFYYLQSKHYENIFKKPIPFHVQERADKALMECLS